MLGVGLGSDRTRRVRPERFGEEGDPRERAQLLDEGLERARAPTGTGEFEPRPVQQPRIPVWVAARWPNRRPLRRAARWDGLFPIDLPEPEALAEIVAEVASSAPPTATSSWSATRPAPTRRRGSAAGATWCLTGFGLQPTEAEVREAIDEL